MLWDTHMHTRYSGDSNAEPVDMINAAIRYGLHGICITDHMDYDYPNDSELFVFDVEKQQAELKILKEKYQESFPVLIGIELGLQPQAKTVMQNQQLLAEHDFDFVIGSSHVVHGFDPYYKEYYEGKSEHEAYLEYFESILEKRPEKELPIILSNGSFSSAANASFPYRKIQSTAFFSSLNTISMSVNAKGRASHIL